MNATLWVVGILVLLGIYGTYDPPDEVEHYCDQGYAGDCSEPNF